MGPMRLKKFYDHYASYMREMQKHYEMNDLEDLGFICRRNLLKIGVDVEKWREESENNQ